MIALERFHLERRTYSLPTGVMCAETVQAIARYLDDIQHGYAVGQFPAKLPSLDEFTSAICSGPDVSEWLSDGGNFNFSGAVKRYLQSLDMDAGPVDSHSHVPCRTVSGPDAKARGKNVKASAKQWYRWLTDRCPRVRPEYHFVYQSHLDPLGMDWTVTGKGDYVGTFPKRLAKFLAKEHGMKLRPAQIETIGNIGASAIARTAEYAITFDRDYLDGSDYEYGNSGSCWWGSNSGARSMLHENGGYAVRVWGADRTRPAARCWLAPHDDFYVLFNAYGMLSLWEFARVLSHSWGWTYKQCGDLSNYGEHGGILYINGGAGIVVGPADVLNDLDDSPTIDLQWTDIDDDCCEHCGCSIDPDYSCSDPDGNSLCEDCFSERYTSCERCGDVYCHDDVYNCDDEYLCQYCAERKGYAECDDCCEWRSNREETADGRTVCESCAEDYARCQECETLGREYRQTVHGEHICPDCSTDWSACHDCERMTDEPLERTDGEAVCEECSRNFERCSDCQLLADECADTADGRSVCAGCQANYRGCPECGELIPARQKLLPLGACDHDSVTVIV